MVGTTIDTVSNGIIIFSGSIMLQISVTDEDHINVNDLTPTLDSVLSIPSGVLSAISNKENVKLAFAVYDSTTLFPVRNTSQDMLAVDTVVGSQVVSGIVNGISNVTLDPPVEISLRLINYVLLPDEYITGRRCVFWDFDAASEM